MENKSVHILQVIPNLNLGGAEKFLTDLSNELSQIGHKITILTFYKVKTDNILVNNLNSNINFIFLNKKKGFDYKLIFSLKRKINQINPDIIHTHLRSLNYVFLANFNKLKIVHTVHNEASKEVDNNLEKFFRKIIFILFKVYPVTISNKSNESFNDYYKSSFIKSKLILNGSSNPELSKNSNKVKKTLIDLRDEFGKDLKVLVNIGRIEEQKNHILLSRAIKKINKLGLNVAVVVLGGFRNKKSEFIFEKLKKLKNKKFILLGEVKNATDYLFLSDYFILSSLYEGMPISLIESFACSAIPISTPVGGIVEMIGKDGFISKDLEIDNFINSIIEAVQIDDIKKSEIINNNYIKFQNIYSITNCAKNYLNYYFELNKN